MALIPFPGPAPKKAQVSVPINDGRSKGQQPPDYWYELEYNDRKLKYTIDIIGNRPPPSGGYPLYIGMHGGGTSQNDDKEETDDHGWGNDHEWGYMYKHWYREPLDNFYKDKDAAVFIAARGVSSGVLPDGTRRPDHKYTDDWDLHCQPESYVLLEMLITHLITQVAEFDNHPRGQQYKALIANAQQVINRDKVYLLGFSAGGDGAFNLGTRISDRFAAVVAAAGHPGSSSFYNVANLPMLLEVGEDDCHGDFDWNKDTGFNTIGNLKDGFQRAGVYLNDINKLLDDRSTQHPGYYKHTCYVVKNAFRNDWNANDPHNTWSRSPSLYTEKQKTLKPTKFDEWLKKWHREGVKQPSAFCTFDDVKAYYDDTDLDPIRWLDGKMRVTAPAKIVWDLRCRPTQPKEPKPSDWEEKRFFYWMYLIKPLTQAQLEDKSYEPEQTWYVHNEKSSDADELHIAKPNGYMGYLLRSGMVDFAKKLKVFPGSSTPVFVDVIQSKQIQEATLAARGDSALQFSAMVYLVKKNDGSWEAKSAASLSA